VNPAGNAFAIEERFERGERVAEFAGMEEMVGAVRAFTEGALFIGERFVEQETAGSQCALDAGEGLAVEILEAQDEREARFRERRGLEVGLGQRDALEMGGNGVEGETLDGKATRGGQGCGAVESCRSEIHGDNGPAAFGEPDGVLARTAGDIESAGMRMRARQERETFEQKIGGSGRRLGGGFAVARLPAGEGVISGGRGRHKNRVNAEGSVSQRREGAKTAKERGYWRSLERRPQPGSY
jgi:hypothetical protein